MKSVLRVVGSIVVATTVFMVGCANDTGDIVRPLEGSTGYEAPTTATACGDGMVDVGDASGSSSCEQAPGTLADGDGVNGLSGSSDGVVVTDYALAFHEVWGKPNYMCGDLGVLNGQLKSYWYGRYKSPASAQMYVGTCASLSGDPARAAFKSVPGRPNYKCADLPSNTTSVWFAIGQGVRRATLRPGNCAAYAIYSGSAPPTSVP